MRSTAGRPITFAREAGRETIAGMVQGVESPGAGAAVAAVEGQAQPQGFRLLRYYTFTTSLAFAAVAVVLFVLQRNEEAFFRQVQGEQREFFAQAQATLARQHEEAARSSLMAVYEASHVNLTLLVGNLLWRSEFAPFVARAQAVSVADCRAPPSVQAVPRADRRCLREAGRLIRALPGFLALDRAAYAAMRGSSVFKIKVFDLRGVTVYSSEHTQIGDDGSGNQGWQSAVAGRPASELTHRDRFSAFERVVEDRDLISTYVPVRLEAGGAVLGVVELYSDVTPFLAQIKDASQRFARISADNEAAVDRTSLDNQRKVNASSDNLLLLIGFLLALLYWVSLMIVANGQRQIDKQSRARAEAARREQARHREKMAALATMTANLSHEVANPLAIIAGIAQELPDEAGDGAGPPSARRRILEQTGRVGAMMRQLSDFATSRSEEAELVDVNAMLKAVCDFHAFDRRFRGVPISFEPGSPLPLCELVPDHLKETMMSLLLVWADLAQASAGPGGLLVQTEGIGSVVQIRVGAAPGSAPLQDLDAAVADDARIEAVRRRVADMHAHLVIDATCVQIDLPAVDAARSGC